MRIYDDRLGRFLSIDPLTGSYPWNSTYAFAENDVIRSIDIDGLEKLFVIYYSDKQHLTSIQIFRAEDLKGRPINLNIYDAVKKIPYKNSNKLVVHYNAQTQKVENIVTSNEELNNLELGILKRVSSNQSTGSRTPNTKSFKADGPKDKDHDFGGDPQASAINPALLSNSFHFQNSSGFVENLSSVKDFNITKISLPSADFIQTGDLNLNSVILLFKTQTDLDKYGDKFTGLLKDKFGEGINVSKQVDKTYIDKTGKKDNKKYNFFVIIQATEKK